MHNCHKSLGTDGAAPCGQNFLQICQHSSFGNIFQFCFVVFVGFGQTTQGQASGFCGFFVIVNKSEKRIKIKKGIRQTL
jgi:hypothetical protein